MGAKLFWFHLGQNHQELCPEEWRFVVMLRARAKGDEDIGDIRAMDKPNKVEGFVVNVFVDLKLKGDELIDQPARDVKSGNGDAVDNKVGGSAAFGVQVGSGGYDVDGTPRGFDSLALEGKVVQVVT